MVKQTTGEYCDAVSDENHTPPAETSNGEPAIASIDLSAIEVDLAAVETALNRLDAGSYWTDEVTGEPIPDQLLVENPLLRNLPR